MNRHLHYLLILFALAGTALASAEDIDSELSTLTESLSKAITAREKKKVTVIDFVDLQGRSSELGKYIAEQLTVNFVTEKREFSVLDRANLKSILAEHKLTASGLVDPENAKKLGAFAGVDALILGSIIPKKSTVGLTARIITTDTAEVVGAAKADFKLDDTVQHLLSAQTESKGDGLDDNSQKIIKTFGDVQIELVSLSVVNNSDYRLVMEVSNPTQKSVWAAIRAGYIGIYGSLIDPDRFEFGAERDEVSGIECSEMRSDNSFDRYTELKPKKTVTSTIMFRSRKKSATAGTCQLQLEVLVGTTYNHDSREVIGTKNNLVSKIIAK